MKPSMKNLLVALALVLSVHSQASVRFITSAGVDLGSFSKIKTSSQFSPTVVAGNLAFGLANTLGVYSAPIAATATTITSAQCGGTFINSGAVQMELPEASGVLGCTLTFVTANASNFDVNPDGADQILVSTNAVGDAIRNATLGNSISLRAITSVNWAPVSIQGTYTDIN